MIEHLHPRWLDARAAVQYLTLDDAGALKRLVKQGRIPAPSYHLGPRSPRWDREALDLALAGGEASGSTTRKAVSDAVQAILAEGPRRARKTCGRHGQRIP